MPVQTVSIRRASRRASTSRQPSRRSAARPINFLNSGAFGFTVDDPRRHGRAAGQRRRLARPRRHAGAFIKVATEIAKDGKFDGFTGLISNPELNKFFAEDRKRLS